MVYGASAFDVVDWDKDGDLDILALGNQNGQVYLYENINSTGKVK